MAESSVATFLNDLNTAMSFDSLLKNYSISGETISGIDGFIFSQIREEEVTLSSNITDYPVEDGNYSSNVIGLYPERVKLSGVAAELTYGGDTITRILDTLSSALIPITALSPELCNQTLKIKSQLSSMLGEMAKLTTKLNSFVPMYNTVASALNSDATIGQNLTIQQKAYVYLEACWKSRKLLKVETPWRYFDDMAIEDLRFVQNATTKYVTEIEVTLKRIITPQERQTEKSELKIGRANSGLAGTVSLIAGGVKAVANGTDITGISQFGASLFSETVKNLRDGLE